MKFIEKILVVILAAFITLAGFTALASPSLEIMKMGKKAGLKMMSEVKVEEKNNYLPLS